MARPHIRLSGHGGYIVDLDFVESWWIEPNVEPFRTESRGLDGALLRAFGADAPEAARARIGARVAMEIPEQTVRDVIAELEQLGMARRIP